MCLNVFWPQYVQVLFDTILSEPIGYLKKKSSSYFIPIEHHFTVVSAILGLVFSASELNCYEKQRVAGVMVKVEYEHGVL